MSTAIELPLNSAKTANTPTKTATTDSLSPFDDDLFIPFISCFLLPHSCLKKQQANGNRKHKNLQYFINIFVIKLSILLPYLNFDRRAK